MEGSLLTIQEVAHLLHLPVSWVREHVRKDARDRIPGFKLGKYWRFRAGDLVAWLKERSV
jgi:excisionase family DNA binding protein